MARWLYKLPLRFRSLFRKDRDEQELAEELRFHLETLIEENLDRGYTREEARYAALRELGGLDKIQEECRDARRWIPLWRSGTNERRSHEPRSRHGSYLSD